MKNQSSILQEFEQGYSIVSQPEKLLQNEHFQGDEIVLWQSNPDIS